MKLVETWNTKSGDDSAPYPPEMDRAVAHVRILTGRSQHPVYEIVSKGVSIGRVGGDSDIVVDDGQMSRRHARVEHSIAGWHLQDLGSRNGGYVDGRGFASGQRIRLTNGAVIRLGVTLMVFRTCKPFSDGQADSPVFPGVSTVAAEVRQRMAALAQGAGHVLILGETGTGKERVSHAFGEYRLPHPFVTLNAANLKGELARSELFGHAKGAFTNAIGKRGLVDAAGDGVLFLDEIGELPIDVQADLLRFLEDGSYRPVGSTELRRSGARVVAATHVDLDEAVQQGRFRRDLLARLRANNAPLRLPALRDRREDILDWTRLFFRQAGREAPPELWTAGALECLLLYPWLENLRGLGSVVNEVLASSPTFPCAPNQLPAALSEYRAALRTRVEPASLEPVGPPRPDPNKLEIEEALRQTQGNMRLAAQLLGINRRKLYRLCAKHGTAVESFRGEPEGEAE